MTFNSVTKLVMFLKMDSKGNLMGNEHALAYIQYRQIYTHIGNTLLEGVCIRLT